MRIENGLGWVEEDGKLVSATTAQYVAEITQLQQKLQRIRQESLTWSLVCQCDCAACEKLFSMIKHAVPQPAPHAAEQDTK